MSEIIVTNIDRLRMSTDGKGIRTLIVAAGCPLRCRYCINPHTWNNETKVRKFTPEKLYKFVSVDDIYFKATGGGIAFGGGEPLIYADFIKEFIDICPSEWNFLMETSLNMPWENVKKIIECIDEFYVDIKAYDEDIYQQYTGHSGRQAFDNLKRLLEICPQKVTVRVPIIPDLTTAEDCEGFVEQLKDIGAVRINRFIYRVNDLSDVR